MIQPSCELQAQRAPVWFAGRTVWMMSRTLLVRPTWRCCIGAAITVLALPESKNGDVEQHFEPSDGNSLLSALVTGVRVKLGGLELVALCTCKCSMGTPNRSSDGEGPARRKRGGGAETPRKGESFEAMPALEVKAQVGGRGITGVELSGVTDNGVPCDSDAEAAGEPLGRL